MVSDLNIILCARSNSKRIKDKNLLKISSKNLIQISIEQALQIVPASQIFLSSDSSHYLKIGKYYKINLDLRSKELSRDDTPKFEVFKHIFPSLPKKYVIDLDISAPLRDKGDIMGVYRKLKTGANIVFAACELKSINPYFNIVEYDSRNYLKKVKRGFFPNNQKSPDIFLLNSIIGFNKTEFIRKPTLTINKKSELYLMDSYKMFDIDFYSDYLITKYVYNNISKFKKE